MEFKDSAPWWERLFLVTHGWRDDETLVGSRDRVQLSRRAVNLLWLLFALSALLLLVRAVAHRRTLDSFRTSAPVSDAAIAADALVPRLTAYLRATPQACGVTAAALRVYQRVAVVRDRKGFVVLFNPHFEPFATAHWEASTETSFLCRPPVTRTVQRASAGTLSHRINGQFEALTVRGSSAHCVQHLLAELDGTWWCPPEHTAWPRPVPF